MKKKYIAIIVIVVAVIFAAVCLASTLNSSLATIKATYTYFEDCINVEGLVIRDEEVYEKSADTIFETHKKDGDRVSAGMVIGMIYGKDASKTVVNKIAEINNRIAELQKQQYGIETSYEDVSKVDSQIASSVSELQKFAQKCDGAGITTTKYELDRLLDNRLVLEGKKASATNELDELQARRDEMEAELSKEDVISNSSGIMTHAVDGFEADVTPDKIEYYTPEAIDAWLDYNADVPKTKYLKIIRNNCWYYAFNITVNQLDNMKIGDGAYIKTTAESNELIPVTVYDISDPSSDKRVTVTVQCTHDIASAFTARKPQMVFVKKVYEGYKVPKTAVVVKNDVVGVYALMGGIVEFRPINIVYSSEDYIMISNEYDSETNQIHMYDDIILSTEDVKEGMLFT